MESNWIEAIINVVSGLVGGGVFYVGYRLFKQKSEFNDKQQFEKISQLITTQGDSNVLQQKNNELQQKQIDSMDKEVMLLRERFQHHRESTEKFQSQMFEEMKKSDIVLSETVGAIVGLKASLEGMKSVFELALKKF